MIKINLIPREIQEKGKGVEWIILGVGLILLTALIAMTSYFFKWRTYQKYSATEIVWRKQLDEQKAKVQEITNLDADKSMLQNRKSTVSQLFQKRLLYPQFMETFFNTVPRDIWITDLTLKEDGQKNIIVVANSNSLSVDAITDWLQTLESNPEKFSGISLSAIEAKQSIYGFTMTFMCHPPTFKGT